VAELGLVLVLLELLLGLVMVDEVLGLVLLELVPLGLVLLDEVLEGLFSDDVSEGRKKPPALEDVLGLLLLVLSTEVELVVFDVLLDEFSVGETLRVLELDVLPGAESVVLVSLGAITLLDVELLAGGMTVVVVLPTVPVVPVALVAPVVKAGARVVQSGMHTSGFVLWIDAQWGTLVCAEAIPKAPRRAAARRLRWVVLFTFMRMPLVVG
jgi:hypothetical protein